MATATLDQTKDVISGLYVVTSYVPLAVDMEEEVFVYNATNDTYSHVANIYDMATLPKVNTVGTAFYRQDTAVQNFTTPTEADSAATLHASKVNELVYEYNTGAAVYDGSTDTTVLSGAGVG